MFYFYQVNYSIYNLFLFLSISYNFHAKFYIDTIFINKQFLTKNNDSIFISIVVY